MIRQYHLLSQYQRSLYNHLFCIKIMYFLKKLHKNLHKIRPIASSCNGPTEKNFGTLRQPHASYKTLHACITMVIVKSAINKVVTLRKNTEKLYVDNYCQ